MFVKTFVEPFINYKIIRLCSYKKVFPNTVIACNHVVYRASICKRYLTAVALTEAEENEQKVAETALINNELESLFESNKYYKGKLDTLSYNQ